MQNQFFSANIVGHADSNKLTPAICGSSEHPCSHKLYIDSTERSGRWLQQLTLEDPGFMTTKCTIVVVNLGDYRSVEVWFDIDHRTVPSDKLATLYTRMEWTPSAGWDVTNLCYQRGNQDRTIPPARIGETRFA